MISISQIKLFKSCRRAYELKYVEKVRPVETSEALKTGIGYHERIEAMYNGNDVEQDFSKESAMAEAYRKYIFPHLKIQQAEQWLKDKDELYIARIDGITSDGILVEHKTTSGDIGDEYEYNLQWDEQILMYMYLSGARTMYYTVIKKPTIRQKQNETDEQYFNRCCEWYDSETESKIRYFIITRTDEEIEDFAKELKKMRFEIEHTNNFYRNPSYCNMWGRRCEYSQICMNYDPNQEYIGYVKGE